MRRRSWLAWAAALLLLAGAIGALLAMPVVRSWDIRLPEGGAASVPPEQLLARLAPFEGTRFLTLSLPQVRAAVMEHPWVADARVVRIWPDRVRIEVTLQQPVARWGDDGLVNDKGEVFRPRSLAGFEQLIRLSATDDRYAPELLAIAAWLRTQAEGLEWALLSLHRHAGGSLESRWWPQRTVWLEERDYRERFARFLEAWPQVRPPLRQAATTVDLRYSNGFSLRTKLSNGSDKQHGAQKTEQ